MYKRLSLFTLALMGSTPAFALDYVKQFSNNRPMEEPPLLWEVASTNHEHYEIDIMRERASRTYTRTAVLNHKMWSPDVEKCLPPAPGRLFTPPIIIHPFQGEEGHWFAGGFTMGGDMNISSLEYYLAGEPTVNPTADPSMPHTVNLFVGDSASPPENPEVLVSMEVSIDGPKLGYNLIKLHLDEDLSVAAGETLFVSIEMPRDDDGMLGVLSCSTIGEKNGFWSNATEAPFPWSPLTDFNLPHNPIMAISGTISQ